MAKHNKKDRHGHGAFFGPIVTVLKDGFLGGLLLIAISHGVHTFSETREEQYNARQAIFKQFAASKLLITNDILNCLNSRSMTKSEQTARLDAELKLVKIIGLNKSVLDPDEFYALVQYTRLIDTNSVKNTCSLSKDQLLLLENQINSFEVSLRAMGFGRNE